MDNKSITLEDVPCNLCGSREVEVILEAQARGSRTASDFHYAASDDTPLQDQLVRCRKCDLVYVSPRPKSETIAEGYAEVDNTTYIQQGDERKATFDRAIQWMKKQGVKSGKLLDVGCGAGFFVKAAKDAGFDAMGIELSRHMAKFGRESLGVSITQGTLDSVDLPSGSFDVVTFWDVLEHVPDPTDSLQRAHRLLKPGGCLLINYPDYASIGAKLLGRAWWFLIDVHIYYFTPATLAKLLRKCGFTPGAERRHWQTLRLGYLLQRANAGRFFGNLARMTGLSKIPFTYYASQKTMLGRPNLQPQASHGQE